MPKMSIHVPHQLARDEAILRLKEFLPRVRQQFQGQVSSVEETWDGHLLHYKFTTFGFSIQGKMAVDDQHVALNQDIPLAAMMFKGKIEESIRQELAKLLG